MDVAQSAMLNRLRLAALACRVAAHTDLFEACAHLSTVGEHGARTYLDTLVACLPNATGRRVLWYRPGTKALSFDEAWVLRCLDAIARADEDSLAFLLRSQVAAQDARLIGHLLTQVAAQVDKN